MLTALFARLALQTGLSPRVLKIAGLVALLALAVLGWNLWLHFHDKGVVAADRAESNLKVTTENADAHEKAADERLADDRAVTQQEKEMRDAIHSGPDSAPDAARVRLGCERLRRSGADLNRIPACSRPEGGN